MRLKRRNLFNKTTLIYLLAVLFLWSGCASNKKNARPTGEAAPQAGTGFKETGLHGRVVVEEKYRYLEGARVFAYTTLDFENGKYYMSEPVDKNGNFKLLLPEGQYYITAKKSVKNETSFNKIEKDDYYCYYGGNPVAVTSNKMFFIGLNCVRKKTNLSHENSPRENVSGIKGRVTYKDKPLSGAYVLAFEDAETSFRGSFYTVSKPTDADGNFELDLPAGTYYIISKKMKKGGEPYIHPYGKGKITERTSLTAGPLKQDDYYCYYDENPIQVKENSFAVLELPSTIKIGDDTKTHYNMSTGTMRIEGQLLDGDNKPVKEAYAFAALHRLMEDKPEYISNPTGEDGKFVLYIKKSGWYYLGGRNYLGRPMRKGDLWGYYNQAGKNLIKINENDVIENMTIRLGLIE
ncbi:MAG: hypothetical protein AB1498_00065 [bacterium]